MKNFKAMKKNYLFATFLFFLFGCYGDNGKDLYLDIMGAIIHIEYFDKEQKGYLQIEGEEQHIEYRKDSIKIEILSFTDEITGLSFMEHQEILVSKYFGFRPEVFGKDVKEEIKRQYVIKYKAPSIHGESVEEIKLIFKVYMPGVGKFEEAWYNGNEIFLFKHFELYESDYFEKNVDYKSALYYNGDNVAIARTSGVHIVLPF